jgi:uncharacterized repeat protein (TIGR02543 family)
MKKTVWKVLIAALALTTALIACSNPSGGDPLESGGSGGGNSSGAGGLLGGGSGTYTVTFNSNGGSAIESRKVAPGGTVAPAASPARNDDVFDGWYRDAALTTQWSFGVDTVNSNTTIYAKWVTKTTADSEDFGGGATVETPITVTDKTGWEAALSGISGNKNYVIIVDGDITGLEPTTTFASNAKVSLRGPGSLSLGSTNGALITIGTNRTLILRGPALKGKTGNDSAVVCVDGSGTTKFTMKSGTISGNSSTTSGGGVYVGRSGILTMDGGTIGGNSSSVSGGGVFAANGTFTMNGGTIGGNIASSGGGGVYVRDGTFTMKSGTISSNSASSGGGVSVGSTGTFTMSGGTISGNSTSTQGGGVFFNGTGTFTMNGGTISGNSTDNRGGGVFFGTGTFTMKNGTIDSNSASRQGGGCLLTAGPSP